MRVSLHDVETQALQLLQTHGHGPIAGRSAANCAWLEACGYPGLNMLVEALADPQQEITLTPDAIGLDLAQISCVFLTAEIERIRAERGRIFLRNVRHGLYLLPNSVRENYGIGCPVDPGFALGGERHKNPYREKLEAGERDGVEVDEQLWNRLLNRS